MLTKRVKNLKKGLKILKKKPEKTQDMPDPRTIVPDDRQRLMQLLRYSNPFAISPPIEENPASPSDFVDIDYQSYQWLFDAAQLPMDPTEIREALKKDTSPIPATINREGYGGNDHLAYWLSRLYRIQALNRHGRLIPRHWWGLFRFWWFDWACFSSLPLPVSCLAHLEQRLQDDVGRMESGEFSQRDHGVPGNVFSFPACRGPNLRSGFSHVGVHPYRRDRNKLVA